jgi:hypothetical protein
MTAGKVSGTRVGSRLTSLSKPVHSSTSLIGRLALVGALGAVAGFTLGDFGAAVEAPLIGVAGLLLDYPFV